MYTAQLSSSKQYKTPNFCSYYYIAQDDTEENAIKNPINFRDLVTSNENFKICAFLIVIYILN